MYSKVIIPPGNTYAGDIRIPASKSMHQRAILLAALTPNPVEILGRIDAKDSRSALALIEEMGCVVEEKADRQIITPLLTPRSQSISVSAGESALCARMFLPVLTSLYPNVGMSGTGTLNTRSFSSLIDVLSRAGCNVKHQDNHFPFQVSGKLYPGLHLVEGRDSSQVVSGMLIALSLLDKPSELNVSSIRSRPYIDLTIDMMTFAGLHIEEPTRGKFLIPGNQLPKATTYTIEGDWSSACFHLVGAALSGSVRIQGLNRYSVQADQRILSVLIQAGAGVEWEGDTLHVYKKELRPFDFDATDCPDVFPSLAVLAAGISGTSCIHGVTRLKNKESDRAKAIEHEWRKRGIRVDIQQDKMLITGGQAVGGVAETYGDHRMAMALTILSQIATTPLTIENAGVIEKSYAGFYTDINAIFGKKIKYE